MEPAIDSNKNIKIKYSKLKSMFSFVCKNTSGLLGILLVFIMLCCALFAPWIAPMDPTEASLQHRLVPPSWADDTQESEFLLGTDQLGRDLLSRIIHGATISIQVGVFGALLAMVIGTILGLLAGYFGKWLDSFIMRAADVQLAFPFILFAIIIMSVLGTGIWKIIIILGLTYWVGFARLIRSQVISLTELEYIHAAKAVEIGRAHV